MKHKILLIALILAFGLSARAHETQVMRQDGNTAVITRWSDDVPNTREDGFELPLQFILKCKQSGDGKIEYTFAPYYLLVWFNDGDYDDTNYIIGADDNCVVKLPDGTIYELSNVTGDDIYSHSNGRSKFIKGSTTYDSKTKRNRPYGGCMYMVDYELTPDQYRNILSQGISRVRFEYNGGFLTLDIDSKVFADQFRALDKEMQNALSGDNILNDF